MNQTINHISSTSATADTVILVGEGSNTRTLTFDTLFDSIKRELGYIAQPVVKCKHCGQ